MAFQPARTGLLLLAMALPAAVAQQSAPVIATYDVVTVKVNKTDAGNWGTDTNDHVFQATNVTLKALIATAYDTREDLISGIPAALASTRFDLQAKIVDPDLPSLHKLTGKQQAALLIPVLAQRFRLQMHSEVKTLPVYDLVVLPKGPTFQPSATDSHHGGISSHNRDLTATAAPMSMLADFLSNQVHRSVIDKTGLSDHYDFKLKWSPDEDPGTRIDAPPPLFTALQEQLGLKLQSSKGPVETIIVDQAEMPTED